MEIIPVLHLLLVFFNVFYGFVTKKNSFDLFYLFLIFAINLSWTFYGGECPMSYYHKKGIDPSYDGKNDKVSADISSMFGKEFESFANKHYAMICFVVIIINSISIYLVARRQNFPMLVIFMLLFITCSYCVTILNKMNFHSFYRILYIGVLFYIFSMYLKSK